MADSGKRKQHGRNRNSINRPNKLTIQESKKGTIQSTLDWKLKSIMVATPTNLNANDESDLNNKTTTPQRRTSESPKSPPSLKTGINAGEVARELEKQREARSLEGTTTTAEIDLMDTDNEARTPDAVHNNTNDEQDSKQPPKCEEHDEEELEVDRGSVISSSYEMSYFIDRLPPELTDAVTQGRFTKKDMHYALAKAHETANDNDFSEFTASVSFGQYLH